MNEITMPKLSDSMQEGTILSWLIEEGELVQEGDELLEIETDKATMAYESPAEGVLKIVAAVGETLPVGSVIATLGDGAAAVAPSEPAAAPEPAVAPAPLPPQGNGADPATVRATPLARRLAQAHRVDLGALEGTGPRGRITRSDVEGKAGLAPVAEPPPVVGESAGETRELTRLQQVVACRMAEAKATIPHFQVQTEACMDALLALRSELKQLDDGAAPVPSVNDFIVKACAVALRQYPRANGSYRDGRFELHGAVNIGIAVAAPDALVVPTIRDADRRSLAQIATESRRLAGRVRDGMITPPELSGATFTVSNLGMYGMTAITPVITRRRRRSSASARCAQYRRSSTGSWWSAN